ncbi:SCP2 domain-containing protein [Frankia sp. AiPs1]|uniref:hypothetical protein n=1 Tax=Frankia sp. AiPa1 TaxID=573492 RepID=UPI00202B640C|nr:hypothetical protein [Frankia sp. AiPa1]MCL9760415.1 hypothetical protein [Frankia sp. AiPa1]
MLTELDDRVLAEINAHAVLGALPRLAQLAPDAAPILARVTRPTTLTLAARGGPRASYTFTHTDVQPAGDGTAADGTAGGETAGGETAHRGTAAGRRARLLFASPRHLNAVIAGTAQPVPVAGPAGLRFLTRVFTPLGDVLTTYLRPTPRRLAEPAFATASALLTLHVVVSAIAIVANQDRSGRFSAAHMPDGDLDLEVGDELRYRLAVRAHRLRVDADPAGPPRAALRFADLDVVSGILGGRESALACVCDGRVAMRGYIPLVDNTNRILDRVGAYLGG